MMNPLLRNAKFFLIKSVFQGNISISQQENAWATLPHNEQKFAHAFFVSQFALLKNNDSNMFFFGSKLVALIKSVTVVVSYKAGNLVAYKARHLAAYKATHPSI